MFVFCKRLEQSNQRGKRKKRGREEGAERTRSLGSLEILVKAPVFMLESSGGVSQDFEKRNVIT